MKNLPNFGVFIKPLPPVGEMRREMSGVGGSIEAVGAGGHNDLPGVILATSKLDNFGREIKKDKVTGEESIICRNTGKLLHKEKKPPTCEEEEKQRIHLQRLTGKLPGKKHIFK